MDQDIPADWDEQHIGGNYATALLRRGVVKQIHQVAAPGLKGHIPEL